MKKWIVPAGMLMLVLACSHPAAEQSPAIVDKEIDPGPPTPQAPAAEAPNETEASDRSSTLTTYAASNADNNSYATSTSPAEGLLNTAWKKTAEQEAMTSSAARQGTDTTHRFIRTADLRFRVKDVVNATLGIEDIVGAHGGWVTRTTLANKPDAGVERIPVSEDSTLEIARSTLVNTIELRVPDSELDSTLRQIGRWADVFDHRTVNADDIRLRMMANAMAIRRAKAHSARVATAIDEQGRRLKETLPAEEELQASDAHRDEGILQNMDIADRVAYSTVSLDIYGRQQVRKEMVANDHNITAYEPPFSSRVPVALAKGWSLIELTIAGLLSIWPVLVLVGAALGLWWRRGKGRRSPAPAPAA